MSTKNEAIANLRDFCRVARAINLQFCIMDGTLLGAIRDGDFCPNDEDDIDVGILSANYDQTDRLVEKMAAEGFQRWKQFVIRGKVEGFGLRRGASHFDVMRINHHPTRPECYNFGRTLGGKQNLAFVYPARHFECWGLATLHGMELLTPADPEGFLTTRYGNWRSPIPRPGFNWQTDSNDESLRYDYDML